MKPPAEVQLSREDGEALRTRLAEDALTAADRACWIRCSSGIFGCCLPCRRRRSASNACGSWCLARSAENLKPRLPGRHRTPAVGLEGRSVPAHTVADDGRPKRSGHLLRASGAPAMDARAPRPTVEPSTWSAGMRPWR